MIDLAIDISRLRLLQLVSPALPVGAFAYSEGLEAAVHAGIVGDAAAAGRWIRGRLGHAVARTDGPLLARLHAAWAADDVDAVERWTHLLGALRESRQLRDADRDMGQALARLLAALDLDGARPWITRRDATFPTLFALAAVRWSIPAPAAVAGLLWSWLEAQTTAAIKLVPLGQTAGQRLLLAAADDIPAAVAAALALGDDDLGAVTPGAAIAAAHHETLEVRLFRS
jgi:urease accessory protein